MHLQAVTVSLRLKVLMPFLATACYVLRCKHPKLETVFGRPYPKNIDLRGTVSAI